MVIVNMLLSMFGTDYYLKSENITEIYSKKYLTVSI